VPAGDTGRYPEDASPVGALDMAGNVAEWVSDDYHPDYVTARRRFSSAGGSDKNRIATTMRPAPPS